MKEMMKRSMTIDREKGFTLIELMIVVAILGILAAIAIPNFMRFQAKSKQSEAKTNLGAIGTTVESFRSENDSYDATWAQLGWAPQGTTRYEYVYNGTDGGFLAACSDLTAVAVIAAGPPPTFVIGATGNIDTDATCDEWTYNQNRVLDNSRSNDVSG